MKLEVKGREDFALISDQYEQITLDKYIDILNERDARIALRRAIYHSPEVVVITDWKKDHLLAAILACANPIKSVTWGRDGYSLKAIIRRGFP